MRLDKVEYTYFMFIVDLLHCMCGCHGACVVAMV